MHAILQPSSAHRWVNCPGSVQAEQQYPDVETEQAREGSASHWVGEQLIGLHTQGMQSIATDFVGKPAPNGVIISDESFEGATLYADDVASVMRQTGIFTPQLEQPVTIPRVHELNWGTPDCSIKPPNKLIVWDYKFGRVAVETRENWQLIDYALGLLDETDDQYIDVELRLVQPRAFHVDGVCRSWTVKGSDLRGFANHLRAAAEESQTENPSCKAGTWCTNCSASKDCMTLQRANVTIVDRIEVLQLHELSPGDRAIELRYLQRAQDLLKERLTALETEALTQHGEGNVTPGFSIGYGRGSVNWDKPDNEVIAMGDLMGIELRKPPTPITPTQAKKLNVDGAVVNSYCKKHTGAARLVTDEKTIAGRVFSK